MTRRKTLLVVSMVGLALGFAGWRARRTGGVVAERAGAHGDNGGSAQRAATLRTGVPLFNKAVEKTKIGKISVDPAVREKLVEFARKPATTVPVQRSFSADAHAKMRTLVSSTMSLDRAQKRRSNKFLRTSYTQDVSADRPLYLSDRLNESGQLFGEKDRAAETLDKPMRAIYREGDDYLKFRKVKEHAGPVEGQLKPATALAQTKSFMVDNGLIAETANDRVVQKEVRDRRIDAPAVDGKPAKDYLVQQDVRLERSYEGKPVINSQATVGILAGDSEIVSVTVSNWNPVAVDGATVAKPALNEPQAQEVARTLETTLKDEVGKQASGSLGEVKVKAVTEGWFQESGKGLIPVLVFDAEAVPTDPHVDPQPLTVVVNPLGGSDVIWQQGRVASAPSPEPSDDSAPAQSAEPNKP